MFSFSWMDAIIATPISIMREQLEGLKIEPEHDEEALKEQYKRYVIDPVMKQFPSDSPLVISFLTSEAEDEAVLEQRRYLTVTQTKRYGNYAQLMQYKKIFGWRAEVLSHGDRIIAEWAEITVIDRDKLIGFLMDNPQDAKELYDLIITLNKKFVSKTMSDSSQRLKDNSMYFEERVKALNRSSPVGNPMEEKAPSLSSVLVPVSKNPDWQLGDSSPVLVTLKMEEKETPLLPPENSGQPSSDEVNPIESPALVPAILNDHSRRDAIILSIAATVLGGALIVAGAAAFVASGAGPAIAIGAFLMAVGKAVLTVFSALNIGAQVAAGVTTISGIGLLSCGLYGLRNKTSLSATDRKESNVLVSSSRL